MEQTKELMEKVRGHPVRETPKEESVRQASAKGRYLGRHLQRRKNMTKEKYDFSGTDTTFTERIGAETAEFEAPETKNTKLQKLQAKAKKAEAKTEKARKRAPHKKEYRLVRQYDEKTGNVTHVLETTNRPMKQRRDGVLKRTKRQMTMEANNFVHRKVAEAEKDNSAVEGSHKVETQAERTVSFLKRQRRNGNVRRQSKVHSLEAKQFKAETAYRYEKYLEENPEVRKKFFQKRVQKQRIKREYAKALRNMKTGTKAAGTAAYAGQAAAEVQQTTVIASRVKQFIAKNKHVLLVAGSIALLMVMLMTGLMSCVAMFGGGVSTSMLGTYQSEPEEIDKAELDFTKMEADLAVSISNIETDYPDYDDYEYHIGTIKHNPFTLINYLSAKHGTFTAAEVQAEMTALFGEMYTLTTSEKTETRRRMVYNEETGQDEEEEYTATILVVTLTVKPLEDIVNGKLAGDTDARDLYEVYNDSHGAMQTFDSPLRLDWYSRITSNYGYRADPFDGSLELHRGLDIGVSEGTAVYAAQTGTVVTAAYDADGYGNYVIIQDADGVSTRYAHMRSLSVSAGQQVTRGTQIGESGNTGSSTGPHLHIECLKNGVYYNPIFYFENGGVP